VNQYLVFYRWRQPGRPGWSYFRNHFVVREPLEGELLSDVVMKFLKHNLDTGTEVLHISKPIRRDFGVWMTLPFRMTRKEMIEEGIKVR
jgi:hypothetical protein